MITTHWRFVRSYRTAICKLVFRTPGDGNRCDLSVPKFNKRESVSFDGKETQVLLFRVFFLDCYDTHSFLSWFSFFLSPFFLLCYISCSFILLFFFLFFQMRPLGTHLCHSVCPSVHPSITPSHFLVRRSIGLLRLCISRLSLATARSCTALNDRLHSFLCIRTLFIRTLRLRFSKK